MNKKVKEVEATRILFPQAFKVELKKHNICIAPGEQEVLIRSQYSLISPGTELAFYLGTHIGLPDPQNTWAQYPFYPGYITVGEVIAVGNAVSEIQTGDQVLVEEPHASYISVPYSKKSVMKIPPQLSPKQALFSYIASISASSILQTSVLPGDFVVVLGMGLVGNLAAQLYELQGAIPIGVDLVENRLQRAQMTHITNTVKAGEDLYHRIHEITGEKDPDIVVEATGVSELTNTALTLVGDGGQVVLLGSPRDSLQINIYRDIHQKGISLIGAHVRIQEMNGLPNSFSIRRYILSLLTRGALSIEPLITHELSYECVEEAYRLLHKEKDVALGVLIKW